MNMITVTAKTLDEAITNALIELNTTSDNLEYTVVEKGSAGIFGLFGKNVVIRAQKKHEEDFDNFMVAIREDKPAKKEAASAKEGVKDTGKVSAKESGKDSGKDKVKESSKDGRKDSQRKEIKKERKEGRQEKPRQKVEMKSKMGSKLEIKKEQKLEDALESTTDIRTEFEENSGFDSAVSEKKTIDVAASEKAAKEFLTQVFHAMSMDVTLETSYNEVEKELNIDMSGTDMGILIGKRGQTLDSLQYLISLVVNKESEGYLRVKLDTENYRERRKETLENLAKNIAYKVKRSRRSVSLEPMNPYERRIIHAALQNDRYVLTRSEGEDPFRHVVISLKRESRENREKKL